MQYQKGLRGTIINVWRDDSNDCVMDILFDNSVNFICVFMEGNIYNNIEIVST